MKNNAVIQLMVLSFLLSRICGAAETISTPFGEMPAKINIGWSVIKTMEWANHYQLSFKEGASADRDITLYFEDACKQQKGYLNNALPYTVLERLYEKFQAAQRKFLSWEQKVPSLEQSWIPATLLLLHYIGSSRLAPFDDIEVESVSLNEKYRSGSREHAEVVITIRQSQEIQQIRIMEPDSGMRSHLSVRITCTPFVGNMVVNSYTITFPEVPIPERLPDNRLPPAKRISPAVGASTIRPGRTKWWKSCCLGHQRPDTPEGENQWRSSKPDVQSLASEDFAHYFKPVSRGRPITIPDKLPPPEAAHFPGASDIRESKL